MKTRDITGAALLLALALVGQNIRLILPMPFFLSMFIVGTCVCTCLVLASWRYGLWAGILIAVVTPIVAFLQDMIKFIPFIPLVAFGNVVYVLCAYLLRSQSFAIKIVGPTVLKAGLMTVGTFFLLQTLHISEPMKSAILLTMSWPQLITGAAGIMIASFLMHRLAK